MKVHQNGEGFTVIELLITLAILAVLAAIAMGNYISFRNKAYCTETETVASGFAAAISDYFANSSRTSLPTPDDLVGVTNQDKVQITGDVNNMTIIVEDISGNCPFGDQFRFSMPSVSSGVWE